MKVQKSNELFYMSIPSASQSQASSGGMFSSELDKANASVKAVDAPLEERKDQDQDVSREDKSDSVEAKETKDVNESSENPTMDAEQPTGEFEQADQEGEATQETDVAPEGSETFSVPEVKTTDANVMTEGEGEEAERKKTGQPVVNTSDAKKTEPKKADEVALAAGKQKEKMLEALAKQGAQVQFVNADTNDDAEDVNLQLLRQAGQMKQASAVLETGVTSESLDSGASDSEEVQPVLQNTAGDTGGETNSNADDHLEQNIVAKKLIVETLQSDTTDSDEADGQFKVSTASSDTGVAKTHLQSATVIQSDAVLSVEAGGVVVDKGVVEATSGTQNTATNSAIQSLPDDQADSVADKTLRGLKSVMNQKGGKVTLRLAPASLGALRITVQMEGGVVKAQIETGNASVRQLLHQQMGTLRHALESQGLTVEQLQVHMTPTLGEMATAGKEQDYLDDDSNKQSQQQKQSSDNQEHDDQGEVVRKQFEAELLNLIA